MNDTPTPRTDKASCNSKAFDSPMGAIDFARTLERELTATREELKAVTEQRNEYKAALQSADNHNHEIATKLEIVTEQRDRLAEALEKAKAVYTPSSKGEYQTGWHDAICWVNQQALQSLNQPTP